MFSNRHENEDHEVHEILLPDLLKIALVHYQFETIHPFLDGNGRVSSRSGAVQRMHGP